MPSFTWERDLVVPPKAALAWWFDYREDDHMGHRHKPLYRGKGAARKILSRTADTVVLEDDFGGGPPAKATVKRVADDKLSVEYESRTYRSKGVTSFSPKGAGTTMRVQFDSEWLGFGKVFGLFMTRWFLDLVRKDVEAHALEMEDEWKRKPW